MSMTVSRIQEEGDYMADEKRLLITTRERDRQTDRDRDRESQRDM